MQPDLRGFKIAVLGGDAREVEVVLILSKLGAQVQAIGLAPGDFSDNVALYNEPEEILAGVQAIILPVPGMNDKGQVFAPFWNQPLLLTDKMLAHTPVKTPVFVGIAGTRLMEIINRYSLRLIELMKIEEVAILNSIPSAEGAIQMAMERLPITIHDSEAFVLGFGKTGMTLARMLNALGARTTVIARNPAQLARAFEMGFRPLSFTESFSYLKEADVIFNTVPSLILTNDILKKISPCTLIIDLASAPGGTDFKAAENLGISAILAPGLPGKVAPKTAGRILANVITRFLNQMMA